MKGEINQFCEVGGGGWGEYKVTNVKKMQPADQ